MTPTIFQLNAEDRAAREQAARLLFDGFAQDWPDAWPTMHSASETVTEILAVDNICLAAYDQTGTLVGWIGGVPQYDGNVWELHPLVVDADQRQAGIGRALVHALEDKVRRRGSLTIIVWSDDETNMTSLGGVDLYPDPLDHIQRIENRRDHPYGFYQRLGYVLAGVIPDANGYGKPDILLVKRLTS
ncbi:MAG: GNAT family N-acetyltransferase [Chloroflexota bacterium]